jgi:hypothetical protein
MVITAVKALQNLTSRKLPKDADYSSDRRL